MRVAAKFPATACRNADFVSGRSQPGRVVDLQVDVETLPAVGMLCVHEDTVKQMVAKLGWKLEQDDELSVALMEIESLKTELEHLKGLIQGMKIAGFVIDDITEFGEVLQEAVAEAKTKVASK